MAETDKIYFPSKPFEFPVGYILISATNVNPVTFLKYGTWELIGNGRTILGASDTDEGEETGGSMTKTLAAANIPGHTHSIAAHTHEIPAHNHTASSNSTGAHAHTITIGNGGSHNHSVGTINNNYDFVGGGSRTQAGSADLSTGGGNYWIKQLNRTTGNAGTHNHSGSSASNGAHAHTITVANKAEFNTGPSGSTYTGSTGLGNAFDITPSYIKLFIWKRIE